MPQFDLVPLDEAMISSLTGKRGQITREYLGYIEQLKNGQAGRLQVTESETIASIRKRLGMVAKVSRRDLVIRQAGGELYFWLRKKARRPRGGAASSV